MGRALTKINLDVLREFLQLPDTTEVLAVLPPGFRDMYERTFHMVLESPDFPPNTPGMAVPEVTVNYTKDASGVHYLGYSWPNERKESLRAVMGLPPYVPPMTATTLEEEASTDEDEDEDSYGEEEIA